MNHKFDARKMTCPIPVIETKKLTDTMQPGEVVEVLVDNEIAVQNLTKFAAQRKYEVKAKKQDENVFCVTITVQEREETKEIEEEKCQPSRIKKGELVVLSSGEMGNGDGELGKALMKAFVFALTKQEHFPQTILLYNGGAFLSCEDSDSLEDLRFLEAQGTEIATCGTCLNYYGLGEKLAVGNVTNMYDIVERMQKADVFIRP